MAQHPWNIEMKFKNITLLLSTLIFSMNSFSSEIINTEERKDISISSLQWNKDEDGIQEISGIATNNTNEQIDGVMINLNVYDKAGTQIGNTDAIIENLEPHGKWKFSAPILEDNAASVKIKNISTN